METVGDQPSLRYEVNIARARKIYPAEETPVPVPGIEYVRARIAGRGNYEDSNRMKVDFNQVAAGAERGGEWIADRNGFANIILGRGGPAPDPSNKGHFHVESSEHWMIMLGQIHYTIEGVPPEKRIVPPFDTVRGVFFEGDPIYSNCGFHERTHVQIAVRNSDCIKGIFHVRKIP